MLLIGEIIIWNKAWGDFSQWKASFPGTSVFNLSWKKVMESHGMLCCKKWESWFKQSFMLVSMLKATLMPPVLVMPTNIVSYAVRSLMFIFLSPDVAVVPHMVSYSPVSSSLRSHLEVNFDSCMLLLLAACHGVLLLIAFFQTQIAPKIWFLGCVYVTILKC